MSVFQEYAELKMQEKALATRIEELKPTLIQEIQMEGADKIESQWGTFVLTERATWEYTDAVKKLQAKEKALGLAKKSISSSVRFTAAKEDHENKE